MPSVTLVPLAEWSELTVRAAISCDVDAALTVSGRRATTDMLPPKTLELAAFPAIGEASPSSAESALVLDALPAMPAVSCAANELPDASEPATVTAVPSVAESALRDAMAP